MNRFQLQAGHYIWLAIAMLIAVVDLWLRVWSPLPHLDKAWQPASLPEVQQAPVVPAQLISQLQSYQQAGPADDQQHATSNKPVDAKQLGDYYLGLYAIYQNKQQYYAILAVQPAAATVSGKLQHWGLAQGNTELSVVAIDRSSVTIQQGDATVTLRLFEKKQPPAVAP
ncbi:hypothetical protein EOE67_03485 [Rheinheimera riviphila]|uniref:Uncharacterized protein n=1 Tax=Rheinheimera riviphila TaxID=1834037 RepID=A0A437R3G6_9GAMM|nr:hypothetical protein [Rheinheimera riviphila]RVU41275.1 hypothetical protein EOE67_03485 [Rheinheimera riviphila]